VILNNDNTFGIELETVMSPDSLNRNNWTVGEYHRGWVIPEDSPEHNHGDGWKTMYDGSILSHGHGRGVEVVSPVLRGSDGIAKVEAMVARLKGMDARVNRSTGMHVHIGWNGNATQLRRLISLVSHHEKALYAATGTPNREGNTYAGSIKVRMKPFENMKSIRELSRNHHNRYQSLNLQNLIDGTRPTVEFRMFAGTLNITKVKAYIQLALALVQKAMSPAPKVKWDRPLNASSSNDTGSSAMTAMLATLGWNKSVLNETEWRTWTPESTATNPSPEVRTRTPRKTLGMLRGNEMTSMVKVLKRMAKKYDGSRS
tara:strand:+ start:291 stop:1235 length:945 start_codon:yes stop_codon:yes gene_type:complete